MVDNTLLIFDKQLTEALQQNIKYINFINWLYQNGAIYSKIQFPALFKNIGAQPTKDSGPNPKGNDENIGGITGVLCTEEIKSKEVICAIPNKILISSEKARNSELALVFFNHQDMFQANTYRDYYVLVIFIMYERSKGKDSFWHDYFEVVQLIDLPAVWEDEEIKKIADTELQNKLFFQKENLNKEWKQIQKILRLYSPQIFGENEEGIPICENEGLYYWAANLANTRQFGWDLPDVFIVPLIDFINHKDITNTTVDLFHSKLHVANNKIYMHQHDFDYLIKEKQIHEGTDFENSDENSSNFEQALQKLQGSRYDEGSERMEYDVSSIYQSLGQKIEESTLQQIIKGTQSQQFEAFDDQIVKQKFKTLFDFENSEKMIQIRNQLIQENPELDYIEIQNRYEETKRDELQKFYEYVDGIQLWGLGHIEAKNYQIIENLQEDDDQEDMEENEEDAKINFQLREKIMSDDIKFSENLSSEELTIISESLILRSAFNNRWYRYNNTETYFILVNQGRESIKKGDQIFLSYGRRSNSFLMENYSFTLTDQNIFSSLEFRAVVSTNPSDKIQSTKQLLPSQKILDDIENLDVNTEILKIKPHKLSDDYLSYLRSVLMLNNYNGPDKQYILVTTPRVVEFEQLIVSFGIEMLMQFTKHNKVFQQTSLESDVETLQKISQNSVQSSFRESTILQYNIQIKTIYRKALKIMHVLKEILHKIAVLKQPITSACFSQTDIEKNDSFLEIYERRMAFKKYFKDLKMNQIKIMNIKKKGEEIKEKPKKQILKKVIQDDQISQTSKSTNFDQKSQISSKKSDSPQKKKKVVKKIVSKDNRGASKQKK